MFPSYPSKKLLTELIEIQRVYIRTLVPSSAVATAGADQHQASRMHLSA